MARTINAVKERRRANLQALVQEYGSRASLAQAIGTETAYIYQLTAGKEGSFRSVTDAAAAKIEDGLGLRRGWLDEDHSGGGALPFRVQEEASYASQPARLSVGTVVTTTQAIRTFLGRRGIEYDPVEHADLFVAVYSEAAKLSESPSLEESVSFASVVADLMQTKAGAR